MGNPSTIWGQLSTPLSAFGSLPYVTSDGITITTDVQHFYYIDGTWTSLAGSQVPYQLSVWNGLAVKYTDTTSAPANAVTINTTAGRLKIPAASSSVVVTCSACFATSIIHLQLETADATLTRVIPVPAAGSFSISGNAAATAATTVTFEITNVF